MLRIESWKTSEERELLRYSTWAESLLQATETKLSSFVEILAPTLLRYCRATIFPDTKLEIGTPSTLPEICCLVFLSRRNEWNDGLLGYLVILAPIFLFMELPYGDIWSCGGGKNCGQTIRSGDLLAGFHFLRHNTNIWLMTLWAAVLSRPGSDGVRPRPVVGWRDPVDGVKNSQGSVRKNLYLGIPVALKTVRVLR
ncbi:hypothetical protein BJY52DRAFT_1422116 [Lactarius psammicola]|nr:hypothetical protein BJY52DRAFT_1422116 [Lactarius psammicola]